MIGCMSLLSIIFNSSYQYKYIYLSTHLSISPNNSSNVSIGLLSTEIMSRISHRYFISIIQPLHTILDRVLLSVDVLIDRYISIYSHKYDQHHDACNKEGLIDRVIDDNGSLTTKGEGQIDAEVDKKSSTTVDKPRRSLRPTYDIKSKPHQSSVLISSTVFIDIETITRFLIEIDAEMRVFIFRLLGDIASSNSGMNPS